MRFESPGDLRFSYSSVPLSVYSPEIVQNFPYGEKADIWALGCILYQMCTLQAPFFSDNMLVLVNKVRYITQNTDSEICTSMIRYLQCFTQSNYILVIIKIYCKYRTPQKILIYCAPLYPF